MSSVNTGWFCYRMLALIKVSGSVLYLVLLNITPVPPTENTRGLSIKLKLNKNPWWVSESWEESRPLRPKVLAVHYTTRFMKASAYVIVNTCEQTHLSWKKKKQPSSKQDVMLYHHGSCISVLLLINPRISVVCTSRNRQTQDCYRLFALTRVSGMKWKALLSRQKSLKGFKTSGFGDSQW